MRKGPIAITGASGHVGTALQARLAQEGNEVRPLGRGADLARRAARRRRRRPSRGDPRAGARRHVRVRWIFGPPSDPGPSFAPFLARHGKPVTLIGRGDQRMAPVFVGDVAEAIVRGALDPAAPAGTFALAGPQELTLDDMIVLLDGAGVRERHVPPSVARLLAHLSPKLNPTLVEVLLADSLPHDPSAAAALGLELRSPREVFAGG